jgi:hypothetical protein
MNVAAVIVEQLEADGHIKRLTMQGSTPQFDIAFPDEFVGERSGPFFFPDGRNEELFKKSFRDCKVLKLAKDSFQAINGNYSLRIERGGRHRTGAVELLQLVPARICHSLGDHAQRPLFG